MTGVRVFVPEEGFLTSLVYKPDIDTVTFLVGGRCPTNNQTALHWEWGAPEHMSSDALCVGEDGVTNVVPGESRHIQHVSK